jgi:membrane dipeptidase
MGGSGSPQWEQLHHNSVVIDTHSDISADVLRLRKAGETAVFARAHLPKWRQGGVDGAVATVGGDQLTDPTPLQYATEAISVFQADLNEDSQELAIATSAEDFMERQAAGKVVFALGIEGSRPFEGSLENVQRLYEMGLRFATLTWSVDTEVGTGAGTKQQTGLTDFGRELVRKLAEMGMVCDVSHASPATFWDAIRMEPGNIIASHSNAAALCEHPRNLTDDQIRAIADQDGVISVCFFPDFLQGDPPGAEDVIDQVAYVGELVGLEHVGLGFDYFDFLPAEEARARLRKAATSPEFIPYPNYAKGLEGIEKLPHITEVMVGRGFSPDDIRGVLGGNLIHTWSRIGSMRTVAPAGR